MQIFGEVCQWSVELTLKTQRVPPATLSRHPQQLKGDVHQNEHDPRVLFAMGVAVSSMGEWRVPVSSTAFNTSMTNFFNLQI